MTPLHYAALQQKSDIVKYLVNEAGADVNVRGLAGHAKGLTALGLARFAGHPTSDVYAYMLQTTKQKRQGPGTKTRL